MVLPLLQIPDLKIGNNGVFSAHLTELLSAIMEIALKVRAVLENKLKCLFFSIVVERGCVEREVVTQELTTE